MLCYLGVVVLAQGCSVLNQSREGDEWKKTSGFESVYQVPLLLQFEDFPNKLAYSEQPSSAGKVTLSLLRQGNYYVHLKKPYRLKACKELATIYQEDGIWQAGWLLAYSFSDIGSCITHKERLKILNELDELIRPHEEIQWLNTAQIQTLEHINHLKTRNIVFKERVEALEGLLEKSQSESLILKGLIKDLKAVETIINDRVSNDSP